MEMPEQCAWSVNPTLRMRQEFCWMDECQEPFTTLKQKLTTMPVLAYPSFSKEFLLKTDGLGAVLSQPQKDGQITQWYMQVGHCFLKKPTVALLNLRQSRLCGYHILSHLFVWPLGNCLHRSLSSKGLPRNPQSKWEACLVVDESL